MVNPSSQDLPQGSGFQEEGIHPASGLRSFVQTGTFASSDTCICTSKIANATNWTVLPFGTTFNSGDVLVQGTSNITGVTADFGGVQKLYRTRLPFPCTPCITYRQTNAAPAETQVFSIRVFGYDQFGTAISEAVERQPVAASFTIGTPTGGYTRRTRLWLSKVFAAITRVEYKASNVQGTDDWIDVGVHWNFDFFNAICEPYTNFIGQQNQGVGTPLRMNLYGPDRPYILPELLGIEVTNTTPQVYNITNIATGNPTLIAFGSATTVGSHTDKPLANPLATPVASISAANPTIIQLAAAQTGLNLAVGQTFKVRIAGDVSTPGINGEWIATVTDTTSGALKFSLPINITAAGATAGVWITIPFLYGPRFATATDNNTFEPVLVMVNGNTPVTLNGFHYAKITTDLQISVPLNTTVAGTSGAVMFLNRPTAWVNPYDSSLPSSSYMGGFRSGQNASGFQGTAHKWQIVRSGGNSLNPNGHPLLNNMIPKVSASLLYPQFPWFYTDQVQFRAYYRSMRAAGRATSSRGSYAT